MRPPIVRFRSPDSAGGLLRIYRRQEAQWPYHAARMHGHRFFVMNFFDRGTGEVRLPDKTVRVGAGHVLFLVPGELHDTTGVAHMHGWVLEFTGDLLGPEAGPSLALPRTDGTPWLAFAGRRLDRPAHTILPAADRPVWKERFVRLEEEARGGALGAREAIRALLHLLLVDLARRLAPAARAQATPLVNEVFEVIERRHAEPGLSLSAIARAVGRSPSHVTATIRADTGMTVLAWLTERRMAEARRRLHETDEDVAIVAERVGYRNPAYFARVFRRVNGVSPRGYRRRRQR